MSGYLTPAVSTKEDTMRDGEIYRVVGANNAQIEQAFNQLRMEVVTLQAALISEVLRTQAMEEVLVEVTAAANPPKDALNLPAPLVVTKEAIEARFKAKLEAYEKKIEERKAAQAAAREAAAAPKIVAPTAEEMAKINQPVTPNA